MIFKRLCFALVLVFTTPAAAQEPAPRLVNTTKIWDAALHNAFTDLVRWQGRFYCAFREGKGHAGDHGKLRIIDPLTSEILAARPAMTGWAYAVAVAPDGTSALVAGERGACVRLELTSAN